MITIGFYGDMTIRISMEENAQTVITDGLKEEIQKNLREDSLQEQSPNQNLNQDQNVSISPGGDRKQNRNQKQDENNSGLQTGQRKTDHENLLTDDNGYIGIIRFPSHNVEMSVTEGWSYVDLKVSACCYSGSPYENYMVIAAHNYKRFFGPIRSASKGQKVFFTGIHGDQITYEVVKTEILQPEDTEGMINTHYELTLFTCVPGGKARFAVRCKRI